MKVKHPRIGIIGAGALGQALAQRMYQSGYTVSAVVSRSTVSAKKLAVKTKCLNFGTDFMLLKNCNVVIMAVPDAAIRPVAKKLTAIPFTHSKMIIVHTSGTLTSSVLSDAKKNRKSSVFTASMHPMQTFPRKINWNKKKLTDQFDGIYFGIEGDSFALKHIKKIILALNARLIIVPENKKTLYHTGGVFASNFLVASMHIVKSMYDEMGLNEKKTIAIMYPIIRQTLKNITERGTRYSMSGPVARKDFKTIAHHRKVMKRFNPDYEKAYKALTQILFSIKG